MRSRSKSLWSASLALAAVALGAGTPARGQEKDPKAPTPAPGPKKPRAKKPPAPEDDSGPRVPWIKLYLTGERIIEGELVTEDEAAYTVKTEVGEAAFPKADARHLVKSQLSEGRIRARRAAKNVYTSLLLGYRIVKPDDWTFRLDPAEPLSDVLIRQPKTQAEITFAGMPDPFPEQELGDGALASLTRTSEAKFREKFTDVKLVASKTTVFQESPALFLEFTMKSKDTQKDFRVAETIFKNEGKVVFVSVWAPVANHPAARTACDGILEKLEFTDANPQEGDRYFNPELLVAVVKPSDWKFTKLPAAGQSELVLALGDDASVKVEAKAIEPGLALDAWAKSGEDAVSRGLAGAKKQASGSTIVSGRLGYRLAFEHGSDSARRLRSVYFVKERERGYVLTVDHLVANKAYEPVTGEVLARFRILNSLLAPGALERGLKAIERFDEGDRLLARKSYAEAIGAYEEALELFPRYSGAQNNLGIALLRSGQSAKARRALEKGHELDRDEPTLRGNFALSLLAEAMDLVHDPAKVEEASRLVDRAKGLSPELDGWHDSLASALNSVAGGWAEKENWDRAASTLEKAVALKPKDATLTKNLVTIYVNAAVTSYNKRSESAASSWAKKALKLDPGNGKAKQVLDALKKK